MVKVNVREWCLLGLRSRSSLNVMRDIFIRKIKELPFSLVAAKKTRWNQMMFVIKRMEPVRIARASLFYFND